jgi:hypothetical protein
MLCVMYVMNACYVCMLCMHVTYVRMYVCMYVNCNLQKSKHVPSKVTCLQQLQ